MKHARVAAASSMTKQGDNVPFFLGIIRGKCHVNRIDLPPPPLLFWAIDRPAVEEA